MNHAVDIKKRLHHWVSETTEPLLTAENYLKNLGIGQVVGFIIASAILFILVWLTVSSLGSWNGSFQHYPSLPLY